MDFGLTPDQEVLRTNARKILQEVCTQDYVQQCDNEARPPREAYAAMAENGWLGLILPEEYGGVSGSPIDIAILLEEAGRQYEELAVWMFRSMVWGCYAILSHGSEQQKQEFLPKISSGEITVCFGLTEPGSGSDATALTTFAKKAEDGGYIINGQKVFTSGMDISDYCLLVARTTKAN